MPLPAEERGITEPGKGAIKEGPNDPTEPGKLGGLAPQGRRARACARPGAAGE